MEFYAVTQWYRKFTNNGIKSTKKKYIFLFTSSLSKPKSTYNGNTPVLYLNLFDFKFHFILCFYFMFWAHCSYLFFSVYSVTFLFFQPGCDCSLGRRPLPSSLSSFVALLSVWSCIRIYRFISGIPFRTLLLYRMNTVNAIH